VYLAGCVYIWLIGLCREHVLDRQLMNFRRWDVLVKRSQRVTYTVGVAQLSRACAGCACGAYFKHSSLLAS
jgi:hypothetical protein